jgi:hypothetical protein
MMTIPVPAVFRLKVPAPVILHGMINVPVAELHWTLAVFPDATVNVRLALSVTEPLEEEDSKGAVPVPVNAMVCNVAAGPKCRSELIARSPFMSIPPEKSLAVLAKLTVPLAPLMNLPTPVILPLIVSACALTESKVPPPTPREMVYPALSVAVVDAGVAMVPPSTVTVEVASTPNGFCVEVADVSTVPALIKVFPE